MREVKSTMTVEVTPERFQEFLDSGLKETVGDGATVLVRLIRPRTEGVDYEPAFAIIPYADFTRLKRFDAAAAS